MSKLSDRLRDIAEEYLYVDAPLKELKSKLLHEAANALDLDTKAIVISAWRRAHGTSYDQYLKPLLEQIENSHIKAKDK